MKNRFFLFLFRWPWGSRRAAREPERRKIYILYEKKHENESCAVFRADIGGPDGKKLVKIAPDRAGSRPVWVHGPGWKGACRWQR